MRFCTSCGDGPEEGLVRIEHGGEGVHELCLTCVERVVAELPDGPDRAKLAQVLIDAGRRSRITDDVRHWYAVPRNVSKQ